GGGWVDGCGGLPGPGHCSTGDPNCRCARTWTCGDRMQFDQLKRREFIALLGGAAATWLPGSTRSSSLRVSQLALPVGSEGVHWIGKCQPGRSHRGKEAPEQDHRIRPCNHGRRATPPLASSGPPLQ